MNKKTKWVTIAIIALIVVAAAVITIMEMKNSGFTWDDLYETVGLTEENTVSAAEQLTVHYIDVGQGDCIFVQTPEANMIIDGGERGQEKVITSYLEQYDVHTIDYVVATHPHSDHIGSLDDVINAYTVSNVIMPRLSQANTPTTEAYRKFLLAVKNSGAKVIEGKAGVTFSLGKAECTVLSPYEQSENKNNMSVVIRLDWGDSSFLFTGDAESGLEKQILDGEYSKYVNVDVLKMGHHGSSTSSSDAFLEAVSPDLCVISCGVGNDYGHPHHETLKKVAGMNTTLLRTDELGSIRVHTDGTKITWEADHE